MDARRSNLLSIAGLLVLTFIMFGDVLFAGGTRVLSDRAADLALQYYSWRDFGFGELAKGHLALWNPYIFGGAPFFGGMQSALLYPLNWLFLVLSLPVAINWSIALNLFALGVFMFCWMRVRGLGSLASFFAGALIMFSGPYFLHVFGGHLPQMAAMTWSPLVFCAIDGLFKTRRTGWCLLGIFAVAMQIFAGFPQYVFYVGIVAGFYSILRLTGEWNWRLALQLLAIYLGGAALTAVQLLPAIAATNETVRGIQVPFEFASQCGFPPENFMTLIGPTLFGDPGHYWGRCYLWETSFFLSITGLVLAGYAAIQPDRKSKWIPLTIIFVTLVLALGAYTPLFSLLYRYIPGFDRFRATSKFIFPVSLFVVLLAATGCDRLLNQGRTGRKFIVWLFLVAAALLIAAFWTATTNNWQALMNWMAATHETYLRPELYSSADFVSQSQHHAMIALLTAAITVAIVAILFILAGRDRRFVGAMVALGVIETFYFCRIARPSFDSSTIISQPEKSFIEAHPGDYRIVNPLNPDSAMSLRVPDIWGYDPNVVRRYAEFITWTQGGDPNNATLYVKFMRFDPLYAMLRLGYVFGQRGGEFESAESPVVPMPHLQLITNYRVIGRRKIWEWSPSYRDEIFAAMRGDFDPTREVILESEPDPKPIAGENVGTARITSELTDALTIEADVTQPAILLITDVYTPAWRAIALPGSGQSKYQLLPANYILRAVPLAAGHHQLRVEYAPPQFEIGKWISIVSAILFGFVAIREGRPRP